ncbi:MAG: peroxiredoxin [Synergistaceae bacterium]|jgi:peroxiredoxin (alkyl hydroperoxide reductase subunit C)|nr:peroxiredoxin [Synergistaceae bacterium]
MDCGKRVRIGEQAPDFSVEGFSAKDKKFQRYTLSGCRGTWVLLFFYPGDFTYVCPTELQSLVDYKRDLEELKVQVFLISTDSKFSHKQWNEYELSKMIEGGVTFPMLPDQTGMLGRPYDFYDAEQGVDLRGTVVIDPDGVVQLIYVNAAPIGRHPGEIVRCIRALKEFRDKGNVVPACWTPGVSTIAPTYENSGKMWEAYRKDKKG